MLPIQSNFSLQHANTLGLPAIARHFLRLTDTQQLAELCLDPVLSVLPWRILGGGSNLVLADEINALVIAVELKGRRLLKEDDDAWYITAAAGENWHEFVQWTLAQGWAGLENLSLIPGTVGAAPVQNIGAYGVEIKDSLFELTAYRLSDGQARVFSAAECQFAYRDSCFKQAEADQWLIAEVVFRLPKITSLKTNYGDIEQELQVLGQRTAQAVAQAVIHVRQRKLPDPAVMGNAGSFFKNPIVSNALRASVLAAHPELVSYPAGPAHYKLAAGWLIERAGWKGRQLGPVGMYQKQALVLVNHGGATQHDVVLLTQAVQADVRAQFGVELEAEPVWW
ncbi:UDP-N-acetylmuramate dehydrogenase [Iodobacter fluviatilis]|uniref:UDP-N-acetylenolpyruvoylglucosamine reductase n=1 Tax=Iodobacter fluviatilis TaxID=537 RepID=A0A7G3G6V8_9NEIS|nr:UDP-N-acetylmuramate dehydrogenase [Iodobacter fluviatilis]QBC42919.1 UDP-N-acetylenolpyruvoylglucosamine reductase [Iodobacter fluviatilis]